MRAKKLARPKPRRTLKATLARFMGQQHFNKLRDIPMLHRFAARKVETPDPVLLAVLAIDRVGPAAVRACASGVEVRVAAPDEATAQVLRQALAQTARRRDTDRLIRIVVD
jgi:hypothetical protein